jgi:DNA polymerase-3 subunit beta
MDTQLSIAKKDLAYGLSIVARAVSSRTLLPALNNIRLSADDDGFLDLAAFNTAMSITCRVAAEGRSVGKTTVPGRTLVDLVSAMPDDEVRLRFTDNSLRLTSGRLSNNLRGYGVDDFPLIPPFPTGDDVIKIAPNVLRDMIAKTAFAAARDESRPILTNVLVEVEGSTVTMVAADGFRLSKVCAQHSASDPSGRPHTASMAVLVPARDLAEFGQVIAKTPELVYLATGGDGSTPPTILHAKASVAEFGFRLYDGKYPDYNQIVPRRCNTRVVLDTAALLKVCMAAEVFARDSANVVRLSVTPGADPATGHVTVHAVSAETGDNAGDVDALVTGEPMEIGLNGLFFIDLLKVVATPQVALEMTTPTSPCLIRPIVPAQDTAAGSSGNEFLHVIMPMHMR